jgi:hypothetical protein
MIFRNSHKFFVVFSSGQFLISLTQEAAPCLVYSSRSLDRVNPRRPAERSMQRFGSAVP